MPNPQTPNHKSNATMSSPADRNTNASIPSPSDTIGDGGCCDPPALNAQLKDGTSVSDPSAPTSPSHIAPPELWGRVLDFMAYGDVQTALVVGKMVAIEAVKYVRVLSFTKGYQLDGPTARRFVSVEKVNCLSLISGDHESTVLCRDTAIGLVPLLVTFPKIKQVRIGGLITQDDGNGQAVRARYNPYRCSSPANHRDLVKVLCQNFLGAFKLRLLPPVLESGGDIIDLFWSIDDDDCPGAAGEYTAPMCGTCKDICSYFPLKELVFPLEGAQIRCGLQDDLFEAVAKREGGRAALRNYSVRHLVDFMGGCIRSYTFGNTGSEEEALRRRLSDLGVRSNKPYFSSNLRTYTNGPPVGYLHALDLKFLDRLIAAGLDPKMVSKESVYRAVIDEKNNVLAKATFDALVARGFALDEADFIVLDERMEPALKELPARIRDGE